MNRDQIAGAIRQAFLTAAVGVLVKHGATAPPSRPNNLP